MKSSVLVVDDSRVVRTATRLALEAVGHYAMEASDVAMACTLMTQLRPNVVLVSPSLHDGSIVDIMRTSKKLDRCFVVLHSSLEPKTVALMTKALGAAGFVIKGCLGELPRALSKWLDRPVRSEALNSPCSVAQ